MTGSIAVMTWNIWWRFGPWEERFPAIVETIRRVDPDIVTLQEVWFEGGTDCAAEIAGELGWHSAARARSSFDGVGHDGVGFGNGVLSKYAIGDVDVAPLPGLAHREENRCVVFARVDAPGGPVQVFSTHLNWRYDDSAIRQAQVRALCEFVASKRPRAYPAVVGGDFNAEPGSDEIRMMTGLSPVPVEGGVFIDTWRAVGTGAGETWSNRNPYARDEFEPDRRIDYVFSAWRRPDGRGRPLESRVVGDAPVDGVWPSDHFGVVTRLRR